MNMNNLGEMNEDTILFLEKVNVDLREVIDATTVDFMIVNSLLKKYYVNRQRSEMTNATHYSWEENKIDLMVANLQYMDIFRQRVEHLIAVHQELTGIDTGPGFIESFFHLHVFQSLTIELDLFQSVAAINSILCELKPHFAEVGKIEWKPETFFTNTSKIKETLAHTIFQLGVAGGDTEYLPIPALTIDQVERLNSLYTMESERLVLAWFLDSMPDGTWSDLSQQYQLAINQVDVENMELF
jgi:hypothetical protein